MQNDETDSDSIHEWHRAYQMQYLTGQSKMFKTLVSITPISANLYEVYRLMMLRESKPLIEFLYTIITT